MQNINALLLRRTNHSIPSMFNFIVRALRNSRRNGFDSNSRVREEQNSNFTDNRLVKHTLTEVKQKECRRLNYFGRYQKTYSFVSFKYSQTGATSSPARQHITTIRTTTTTTTRPNLCLGLAYLAQMCHIRTPKTPKVSGGRHAARESLHH